MDKQQQLRQRSSSDGDANHVPRTGVFISSTFQAKELLRVLPLAGEARENKAALGEGRLKALQAEFELPPDEVRVALKR